MHLSRLLTLSGTLLCIDLGRDSHFFAQTLIETPQWPFTSSLMKHIMLKKYRQTIAGHVGKDYVAFHSLGSTSNRLPTPIIIFAHLLLWVQYIVHCILLLEGGSEIDLMKFGPFDWLLRKSHCKDFSDWALIWTGICELRQGSCLCMPHVLLNLSHVSWTINCHHVFRSGNVGCIMMPLGLHLPLTNLEKYEHGLPLDSYPPWAILVFPSSVIALGF